MSDPSDMLVLIQKHFDGELSGEDADRLQAWLRESEENLDAFLDQLEIHTSAAELVAGQSGTESIRFPTIRPGGGRWGVQRQLGVVAAAALLMAVVYTGLRSMGRPARAGLILTVSEVKGTLTVSRAGGAHRAGVGDVIRPGDTVTTDEGTAKVAYADGSILVVGEDVEFSPGSSGRFRSGGKMIRLKRGLVTFRISTQPEGRPMAVRTPHAEVEVVGTTFTVLGGERASCITVEDGAVSVRSKGGTEAVAVAAGQKAIVAPGAELERRPVSAPESVRPLNGIVETFEGDDGFEKELLSGRGKNSRLAVKPTKSSKVGQRAVSATYDVPADGWAWFGIYMSPAQDWTGYTHVTFWFHGDGRVNEVRAELRDQTSHVGDGNENWTYPFKDNSKGWRRMVIPLKSFKRRDPRTGRVVSGRSLDLAMVTQFGIFLWEKGTVRVDDVRLVRK